MKQLFVKRSLVVWLILMAIESVHGTLRALLIQPRFGDVRARQIGVVTGSLLIVTVTYAFSEYLQANSRCSQLRIGFSWAVLTVCLKWALAAWCSIFHGTASGQITICPEEGSCCLG